MAVINLKMGYNIARVPKSWIFVSREVINFWCFIPVNQDYQLNFFKNATKL
jgi:hypothetical protein